MTGMLVLLPALAFAWWGRTAYPDTFLPLVEDLESPGERSTDLVSRSLSTIP